MPDGTPVTAEFVIDAYRPFEIEKSFRMSEHDLHITNYPAPCRAAVEGGASCRGRQPASLAGA